MLKCCNKGISVIIIKEEMISFFYGEVFDMNINSDLYINFKEEI